MFHAEGMAEHRLGGRTGRLVSVIPKEQWADTMAGAQGLVRRVPGATGMGTLRPLE